MNSEGKVMAVWVVRGGSKPWDAVREFLTGGSVGVYFLVDRDISGMGRSSLRAEVEQSYIYDMGLSPQAVVEASLRGVITRFANQLLSFRDSIEIGDTIIMPRKAFRGHTVARGIVDGGYHYRGWNPPTLTVAGSGGWKPKLPEIA